MGTRKFVAKWLKVRLALRTSELGIDFWVFGQTWLSEGLCPLLQVWLTEHYYLLNVYYIPDDELNNLKPIITV